MVMSAPVSRRKGTATSCRVGSNSSVSTTGRSIPSEQSSQRPAIRIVGYLAHKDIHWLQDAFGDRAERNDRRAHAQYLLGGGRDRVQWAEVSDTELAQWCAQLLQPSLERLPAYLV